MPEYHMEEDINLVFESIACSDNLICKNGFDDGFKKGEQSGLKEGYHFGFHRGIDIGREIGFYSGFADIVLVENPNLSTKLKAMLMKFQNSLKTVPHENIDVEFTLLVQDLRSSFKTICSLMKLDSSLPIPKSSLNY